MELSGSYEFNAPPARVWATLMDPQVLSSCMPGCESFETVGEGEYQAVVSMGIGPVRGRYSAKISLRDQNPPQSYTLVVAGSGAIGFANGESHITLIDNGDTTTVRVHSDSQIGGTVARVGQRMMGSVAKGMLDKFFGCLAQAV